MQELTFQHLTHMGSKHRFINETMFLGYLLIFHKIWGYMKTTHLSGLQWKRNIMQGPKYFQWQIFSIKLRHNLLCKEGSRTLHRDWLSQGQTFRYAAGLLGQMKSLWKIHPSSIISFVMVHLYSVTAFQQVGLSYTWFSSGHGGQ